MHNKRYIFIDKALYISYLVLNPLTVNSIWGDGTNPPNCRQICVKNGKYNQYDFLQVLPKSSWATFKTIFETLSALWVCHVNIIGGAAHKKYMIFEIFGAYFSEFFIFPHQILVARS